MVQDNKMVLIGIVTDQNSEEYINNIKKNNSMLNRYHIIYIKESNIQNVKNVKFDILIINRKFSESSKLNNLLRNSKFIILNGDIEIDINLFDGISTSIITYGYNSKCTITISSVTEDSALICLQRNIISSNGEIEQQEIRIDKQENSSVYDVMLIVGAIILYNKDDIICAKL